MTNIIEVENKIIAPRDQQVILANPLYAGGNSEKSAGREKTVLRANL